jgi:hypothetical protein
MSDNQEQTDFLDFFLDDGNSFDYAVLIDAPWGRAKRIFSEATLRQNSLTNERQGGPPIIFGSACLGRPASQKCKMRSMP